MKVAPMPESGQGGGSTVTDAEVAEFVAALRENPARQDAQADDQPQFAKKANEKKSAQARSRTGSAADRMRQKVADVLELDEGDVSAAVRAVETDGQGKPKRYGYWLTISPKGQDQLGGTSA
jgi:hypothetical protein